MTVFFNFHRLLHRWLHRFLFAFAISLTSPFLMAAPDEIKVFTDEVTALGEHSMEIHVNAARARRVQRDRHTNAVQIMPEYSYGFAKDWEFSLQLPSARQNSGWRANGFRTELQYVAPHDDDEGGYWGWNAELARNTPLGERRSTTLELIPIAGYRVDQWHFVVNPAFTVPITGESRRTTLELSAKLAYRLNKDTHLGVEHYWELGPIRHFEPRNERYQMRYIVLDRKIGKADFNFGVGRGQTDASDKWVIKVFVDFPL